MQVRRRDAAPLIGVRPFTSLCALPLHGSADGPSGVLVLASDDDQEPDQAACVPARLLASLAGLALATTPAAAPLPPA
ncbi:hypothetical protein BH20ACT8_BH20ACT8_09640 [soil metagenome]